MRNNREAEVIKMKASILLIVLTLGLLITGCSKATTTTETGPNVQTGSDAAIAADITIDTSTANPDIGMLDDTAVSDGLPQ